MRKLLSLILALVFVFSLSACNQNEETQDPVDSNKNSDITDTDNTSNTDVVVTFDLEKQFRVLHELVMTNNPHNYEAKFEEWMDVVSPPTDESKQVEFTINNDHLKWRYVGEENWNTLVNLLTLLGGVTSIEGYYYDDVDLIMSFNSENKVNLGELDFVVKVEFFGFNQTLLEEQYVKVGTSAVAPTIPDETGYEFVGWNVDFSNVSNDLVVQAIYTESE